MKDILNFESSIFLIPMSTLTKNALLNYGKILTIKDFILTSKYDLLHIRSFGRKAYESMIDFLYNADLVHAKVFYDYKVKSKIKQSHEYKIGFRKGFSRCRNLTIRKMQKLDIDQEFNKKDFDKNGVFPGL